MTYSIPIQDGAVKLGTDSVTLAGFARPGKAARIADLGCGSGAIALLLCHRYPGCTAVGLELNEADCETARQNAAALGLAGRVEIRHADLRERSQLPAAGTIDCAVSNPPYFPAGSGAKCPDPRRQAARSEETCTLDELCAAAEWLLHDGGDFFLVHRPERLVDLCCTLRAHHLEPKRIRFVRHHAGAPVNLILLQSKRGANPGLVYEPDLLLFGPDGAETPDYLSFCGM